MDAAVSGRWLRWLRWLTLALLLGAAAAQSAAQVPDLLPPSLAFKATASAADGQTVVVRFEIAQGYYLYRDKFRFSAEPASVQLGTPSLPKGLAKVDDTFGAVEVYYQQVQIRLPVERNSSGPLPLTLNVSSQGCADAGVCYPPQRQTFSVELPDQPPAVAPSAPSAPSVANESGRIAQLLKNAELWLVVLSFFGFGLLLSLTPCVFPMLPIVSGIIVGAGRDGHGVSHRRGFALSLCYVLGMAVTYAAAGVVAGLSGTLVSSSLQNVWVLGGFALIFVVLALSMFGFFELQLPTLLQSRVSREAAQIKGGSLPGVALMGALSALIVGPCVAAPLAGALLYIGQSGDALQGGLALFCMALGMGVPLLVVGASAGTLLPKSGAWMVAVKKVFGVILLASALTLVAPVIPAAALLAGWALLLIVPAIYLKAIDPLPAHAGSWSHFWKGIGVVMLIAGAALLVGALSGARDPWRPLAGLRGAAASEAAPPFFARVGSLAELEARIKSSSGPVLLDFYADWCVSCKEMERETFADARVQRQLAGWTLLRADVTANSDDDKALLARFNLFGPPAIVLFDAQGREAEAARVVGFQDADAFLATLARVD